MNSDEASLQVCGILFPLGKVVWYILSLFLSASRKIPIAAGMKASHKHYNKCGSIDESIISLVITRLLRVCGDDAVPTSIECTLFLDEERIRM